MKITNLEKLNKYVIKIIQPEESLNYSDKNKETSIFISDHICLTNLFSVYDKMFLFSKKFNRNLFANKYIRTGKISFNRDLNKLRSLLLRNHIIFTPDEKESDCYDLTLESSSFKQSYPGINHIDMLNKYLEKDYFINNKENINIYWIINDKDSEINNIAKSTLMLQATHKKFVLNPEENKNINSITLLYPFDDQESKEIKGLKFLISKVYDRNTDERVEYQKIKLQIEKLHQYASKLSKKPLFDIELINHKNDSPIKVESDKTYELHNDDIEIQKKDSNKQIESDKIEIKNVDETQHWPKDKNQINIYTNGMLLKDYMAKSYHNDMFNMANHAIQSFLPNIQVKNISIEDANDGITDQERYIIELEDKETNKTNKISVLVPTLSEDKFFKIYNKIYTLSNQVYSNLINKIKEDTVAFTSSHTKTIVYIQGRSDDRIGKYFSKNPLNIYTKNEYIISENKYVPNSLHVIFKYTPSFIYRDYYITYDIYQLNMKFDDNSQIIGINKAYYPKDNSIINSNERYKKYIEDIYARYGKDSLVIYNTLSDSINNKPFLLEMKSFLEKFDGDIKKMPIPGSSQFARMNIAGKKLPVIIVMLIAYLGKYQDANLNNFFDRYFPENVHVDFSDKSLNEDNIISIKYKDGYMNIFIYQSLIGSELLFSILRKLDMSEYTKEDIDQAGSLRLLLYAYLKSQKFDPNVIISAITASTKSILDPITLELLTNSDYSYYIGSTEVKPRDIIEILYYCVNLLNDRTYKIGNDFSGYRIRNMETVPAILYKLLTNSANETKKILESKNSNRIKALNNISLKEDALLEEFRNLTTFESFSDLNISNEIGLTSKATYKGFAGINNNRSISYDLRATNPSSIGFVDSGNNVDNMNVGSNRMMPFNPNIEDIRGANSKIKNLDKKVMNKEPLTDFETSSLLSFDTYQEPFLASSADAPRVCMASIQARHGIPLSEYDDMPIKTGLEDSIKEVVSSSFVIRAPKVETKYKVKNIDEKNKVISLIGSKGNEYDVSYKSKVANNSGGGFHHLKEFEPCVKVGENVEADKPVALDKGSFKNNNYTACKLLRTSFINYGETFEDSAFLAESVAKKLVFNYITEKSILIRNDQTIIKCLKDIDTELEVDDPILIFSKDDGDNSDDDIFKVLNTGLEENEGLGLKTYIKTKYPGKIVDIKVEYNGDSIRDIPELKALIKKIPKENIKKINSNKMAGEIAKNGTLISYYILTKIPAMSGSKATNQSTKSVFVVKPDDQMPRTLDGEMIEYVTSSFSILTRMTINNYKNLYLNKCIMKLRKDLKKIIK